MTIWRYSRLAQNCVSTFVFNLMNGLKFAQSSVNQGTRAQPAASLAVFTSLVVVYSLVWLSGSMQRATLPKFSNGTQTRNIHLKRSMELSTMANLRIKLASDGNSLKYQVSRLAWAHLWRLSAIVAAMKYWSSVDHKTKMESLATRLGLHLT